MTNKPSKKPSVPPRPAVNRTVLVGFLVVLLFGSAVAFFAFRPAPPPTADKGTGPSTPIAAFSSGAAPVGSAVGDRIGISRFTDISGQTVVLGDGRPAALYFMATWCPSCVYGETQLRQVQSRLGRRAQLVTVDVDPVHDTPATLSAFVNRYGGAWPHVLDSSLRLVSAFGVTSLDTLILINGQGVIVSRGGPQPAGSLTSTLGSLLR